MMHLPALLIASLATAQALPSQLFSNLVPQKVLATYNSLPKTNSIPSSFPQYTDMSAGNWLLFSPDTWTTGFFPTTLYALNERKNLCGATSANGLNAANWLTLGRAASTAEIPLETKNNQGHDVGFLSFPFVEELAVNPGNQTALTAVRLFAADLAARFNSLVGCTRSWDTADPTDFTVIIDNMMNLEVLFLATELFGNQTLRNIAIAHADTTMMNHIRSDGSTWHVVEYNSTTGAVIKKRTAQGFSDSSTWSRGQAWGVYGFANMYKRTGNTAYLTTARKLAKYFLNHVPSTGIVPWDFNAPTPAPADSSASNIMTVGLLLLADVDTSPAMAAQWKSAAINLLNKMTALAWNPSWKSLLSNGTVNKPANNYLTGTVYGDYYFIKAGNILKQQGLATC